MADPTLAELLLGVGGGSQHPFVAALNTNPRGEFFPFSSSNEDGLQNQAEVRQMYGDHKKQPQEAKSKKPTVWPSENWYEEKLGITSPRFLDNLGSLQTAAWSAADGALFGVPSAVLKRVAPGTEATLHDMRTQRPAIDIPASVAGALTSPANALWRAAGNKAMGAGYNSVVAAGLDGLSAGALVSAPGVIAGDGVSSSSAPMAQIAAGTRLAAPYMSNSAAQRAVAGGVGGAWAALPEVAAKGDWAYIPNIGLGALYGLAQRPHAPKGKAAGLDKKFTDDDLPNAALAFSAPGMLSLIAGGLPDTRSKKDQEKRKKALGLGDDEGHEWMSGVGYGDRPAHW